MEKEMTRYDIPKEILIGLKEEFQYLYKEGIVRLRYMHTRYDNPEDIES